MTEQFEREERYVVVKIKDMTPAQRIALQCHLEEHGTPTRECVVVEPDWPIYEIVWHLVERVATGQRLPFMTDDDPDNMKADLLKAWANRLEELADNAREGEYSEHAEGMQDAAVETMEEADRIRRQSEEAPCSPT